jgi:hypothetical protein
MGINASEGSLFCQFSTLTFTRAHTRGQIDFCQQLQAIRSWGLLWGGWFRGRGRGWGLIICHENLRTHHTTPSSLITMSCETSGLTNVSF